MLDPDFLCTSPGSRPLVAFEEAADQILLTAEIRRTLEANAASVPERIAKGQMTSRDADRDAGPWRAIAADLEAQDAWLADHRNGTPPRQTLLAELVRLRGQNGITWAEKVAVLRKEITRRRDGLEAAIAKGMVTRASGTAQLERLEAVHFLYWRRGFAFDATLEELRAHSEAQLDAIERSLGREAAAA